MSKRLYPILVIALMASLVLPRVVSPIRAQGLEERLKISREKSEEIQQQNAQFSEKLRTLQEERSQEIQQRVEEQRQKIETTTQDALEKRAQNLEEYGSRLAQRFTLYETRLAMVIDRLQARLEKLETEGKDITAAQAKLDEAKALLEEADQTGEASVQIFTSIQLGDTSVQQSEIVSAREKAQVTRQTYVEVMKALKDVIALIKQLQ